MWISNKIFIGFLKVFIISVIILREILMGSLAGAV